MKKEAIPEISLLRFLLGKWNTTGKILAKDGSVSGRIDGTDSYKMILRENFILHKVDVKMNSERIKIIEIIGGYDSKTKKYRMRSFDNQGSLTDMEGYLDDKGNFNIVGDKMRACLSVINKKSLIAHWENSEDNENWQPWMEVKLTKK